MANDNNRTDTGNNRSSDRSAKSNDGGDKKEGTSADGVKRAGKGA